MNLNAIGLELIKSFEGLKLIAYKDSVGVWTIGYGHTASTTPGMSITEDQATQLLKSDLQKTEDGVSKVLNRFGLNLNDNQYSALVSLSYNVGVGRLAASSIITALDNDNTMQAADAFLKYTYAKGIQLPGLVRRRKAERALFLA